MAIDSLSNHTMPGQATTHKTSAQHWRPLASCRVLAGRIYRWVASARVRSESSTRRRYGSDHFQGSTYTHPNRYQPLFCFCRDDLANRPAPRILSFGCSTGEEILSLAELFSGGAAIIGVDINRWCLLRCAEKIAGRAGLRVWHRKSQEFNQAAEFDAIFCLAVFQRTEHRTQNVAPAQSGFTFQRFNQEVEMLHSKLKPGGLFFVEHCDYRFEDTDVASAYEAVSIPDLPPPKKQPVFGRDNHLLEIQALPDRCFRKR